MVCSQISKLVLDFRSKHNMAPVNMYGILSACTKYIFLTCGFDIYNDPIPDNLFIIIDNLSGDAIFHIEGQELKCEHSSNKVYISYNADKDYVVAHDPLCDYYRFHKYTYRHSYYDLDKRDFKYIHQDKKYLYSTIYPADKGMGKFNHYILFDVEEEVHSEPAADAESKYLLVNSYLFSSLTDKKLMCLKTKYFITNDFPEKEFPYICYHTIYFTEECSKYLILSFCDNIDFNEKNVVIDKSNYTILKEYDNAMFILICDMIYIKDTIYNIFHQDQEAVQAEYNPKYFYIDNNEYVGDNKNSELLRHEIALQNSRNDSYRGLNTSNSTLDCGQIYMEPIIINRSKLRNKTRNIMKSKGII